ncbi:alpha,alpha-trehalose-phosphate synthase (UDP-forming) [Geminicoccaceae bacterium 1502E]|nr:alpha,alpha-trehalose-phosphate synthase (UDP-forming) [Geminicoccaceae bacterium 1502E]
MGGDRLEAEGRTLSNRLIVVSNRVTQITGRRAVSAGGLAVGIQAALEEVGGLWFGWSGRITEKPGDAAQVTTRGKITYALTDLSEEDHAGYYAGFANRTLWPLFHYRIDLASFEREWYETYRRVNERFADQLVPLLREGDVIWVHDYHLIPLAAELRARGVKARIGFFLHIPFPAQQIFVTMPWHRQLATDLCAYDLVGFQTEVDLLQFWDYVTRELEGEVQPDGRVRIDGRSLRAVACPIGVDHEEMATLAASADAQRQTERLQLTLRGRKLVFGVDRLDYTKGIPERLRAFEELLRSYEEHRGRVVLMQISAPSREDVPEYHDLRRDVERLSGHINGRFADTDWMPIRYINRAYTRRVLAGFYRMSRIGFVTPLRDGLNLVAEEFVAAQIQEDPGVLVLSRFAGAAGHMKGALIVNPYDTQAVAGALHQALVMSVEERRDRHAAMLEAVRANDLTGWRRKLVRMLLSGE